jgi:hypothetical protein
VRRFGRQAGARKASLQYAMKRSNSDSISCGVRNSRVQYTPSSVAIFMKTRIGMCPRPFLSSVRVDRLAALDNLLSPGSGLDRQIRRRTVVRASFT